MKLTSHELDKQKDYYHLLPNSDSKNVGRHGTRGFNKYVLAAAILASTNSVLLGYDIGVMSGPVLYIKDDLKINSTQQEILVGCLNLCSLIGSLAAGKTSDSNGRRYTIVLAAATFFAGAVLMGLAPSFPFLMAGRVLAGIGVGYSLMIGPLYTAEISPAMTRGFLSSLPEVFINMGILLGYVSNFTLSGLRRPLNWRLMLGLDSKAEADARLIEMANAAETWEQEPHLSSFQWKGQGVWKELLRPTRPIRGIIIAAIGINFFMQASGNDAIVYYSPQVFKDAGIHDRKRQFGVTIIMGIVKTCFVFVSALFLDHYGRRPLLLLGTTGMAISLACLGLGSLYLQQCND
ncbi:Polyol transporter 5 [Hibiscus syriacus]|uniref:Polyol transporter 5 n=1 Tax=Hibiscus syriacus TaxID=106335 RepID=A0A6A2WGN3_HIBSY|nr:Polyol transporter 5 [Hibiscus syriacus]